MSDEARTAVNAALAKLTEAERVATVKASEQRAAEAAAVDARRDRESAEKDVGRALRNLRIALDVPAGTVARNALGYYNPVETPREYMEIEDGETVNREKAEKIAKWLRTHAVR